MKSLSWHLSENEINAVKDFRKIPITFDFDINWDKPFQIF